MKSISSSMRTLTFLVLCLALGASAWAQSADLTARLKPGKRYVYRTETMTDAKISGGPPVPDQKIGVNQEIVISVLKALPEGGQQLEIEITKVDSDNPLAGAMAKAMEGLKIRYLTTKAGAVDKVEDVKVPQALEENPALAPLVASLKDPASIQQYAGAIQSLPGRKVSKGESWADDKEVSANGIKVKTKSSHTYTGPDTVDGKALDLISSKGQLSMNSDSSPVPGATVNLEKGDIATKSWFDAQQGTVVKSEGLTSMKMKIAFGGQEMVNETKTKSTTKLLRVEDIK